MRSNLKSLLVGVVALVVAVTAVAGVAVARGTSGERWLGGSSGFGEDVGTPPESEPSEDTSIESGPSAGAEWKNSFGMSFRWCPPGRYETATRVGSVTIGRGFWLGTYPVTQGEWSRVMECNPSQFQGSPADGRRPVENVSWDDAQEFIRKLNQLDQNHRYRLPTEAEWEYAARAGTTGMRYGHLDEIAWYRNNSKDQTHPVGLKRPNAWGLHDMLGNVEEWCSDRWRITSRPSQAAGDPTGSGSGKGKSRRVFRGGSWRAHRPFCHVIKRLSRYQNYRSDYLGFRLVRE